MKNKLKGFIVLVLCLAAVCLAFSACNVLDKKDPDDSKKPVDSVNESGKNEDSGNENPAPQSNSKLAFYPLADGNYAVGIGAYVHAEEITVPDTYLEGKVTAIAEYGFEGMHNLKKITLPATVTEIPEGAFHSCRKLESIVIGNETYTNESVLIVNGETLGMGSVQVAVDALMNTKFMSMYLHDVHDAGTTGYFYADNVPEGVTRIDITPKLNAVTDMYTTTTINVDDDYISGDVEFGTYGLFKDIKIELYKGEKLFATYNTSGVKVTASHYNFMHLNATYPVLVASLKLSEITDNGQIPTFTALARSAAYNWDELPYNMSPLPVLTEAEATSDCFHSSRDEVAAYIKELYELNPNSKFSLYIVDNYVELIVEFLVANGIPEDNWNAVMLSDGSGTAYQLSLAFGVDNPAERYNVMAKEWADIKEHFYGKGFSYKTDCKYIYENTSVKANSNTYSVLEKYAYVVAKGQSNVEWWVNRLRAAENLSAINDKDATFTADIIATAKSFYTNSLLAALTPEQTEEFKALYNFNDEMFSVAEQQNKKIMVIMGASWNIEKNSFYENIKMTMNYYGDDYVYYYKGHPGYPTSLYEGRKNALKQLEDEGYVIYELDNAIAAEVIMFFYPEIYSSGWASSTYDSWVDHTKAGLLYDETVANAGEYNYGAMMEAYTTKLTLGATAYGNIILDVNKQYCLMEYNTTDEYVEKEDKYNSHEIAIYNVTDDTVKYYKSTGVNTWQEVTVTGDTVS